MHNDTSSADGALITIQENNGELLADSRDIAAGLGIRHLSFISTIDDYKIKLESKLGVVRFEIEKPTGSQGGRPLRYALLTEDQAAYLATLSRNTDAVVGFKLALVVAFRDARRALEKQPVPAPQFEIPATFSEALLLAGRLQAENERLDAKLRNTTGLLVEALPAVDAYEEFLSHDEETEHSWKVVADMLREHGVGRNRLLKTLRAEGVLIDGGKNHNTPYRQYIEAGYFRVVVHPEYPNTPVTLTTATGIAFLSASSPSCGIGSAPRPCKRASSWTSRSPGTGLRTTAGN